LVTGWPNQEIATARTWIDNIYGQIQFFKAGLEEARSAENYNRDSSDFYYSLRDSIMAMHSDVETLRKYVIDNKDKLENYSFYESEIESLNKRVGALEIFIVQPGVTKEEAAAENIRGIVTRVEDGDTFYIGERTIRMAGTDAPEGGTPRGELATKILTDLILGKEVEVKIDNHSPFDIYGRVLGVPYLGDQNMSLEMVARCMASVNTKFGKHHFVDGDQLRQASEKCVMGWPLVGEIEVVSDPPKATVWVDGNDVGERTPAKLKLSVGSHHVVVFKTGYAALHDMIMVDAPRKRELPPYKLQKLGTSSGLVEIHINPIDSATIIYVNDVVQGVSPVVVELPIAEFAKISTFAEGYASQTTNVKPMLGRIVKLSIDLKKS
jgi:endonuclease YncB( thermonuclease family)